MRPCDLCGVHPAADRIGICADCLRRITDLDRLRDLHAPVREWFGLPVRPPDTPGGLRCALCANECAMGEGEWGYCGLRQNLGGRLHTRFPRGGALCYAYLDPLPTNCCAAWFCHGSHEQGSNLAVFFYGCNFDCLFCQNASHKELERSRLVTRAAFVDQVRASPRISCICYFGGSPEPQLPFALRTARRIHEASGGTKHICWEWNGAGHPKLVERAARLSEESGGTVKFDLKAFSPAVHVSLTGTDNARTLANFRRCADVLTAPDVLTATTLLVPGYVDEIEVEGIARFIAAIDPSIPYSLLVFHPDFMMRDLPVTPREQVEACAAAAEVHLERVHIGNLPLLQ